MSEVSQTPTAPIDPPPSYLTLAAYSTHLFSYCASGSKVPSFLTQISLRSTALHPPPPHLAWAPPPLYLRTLPPASSLQRSSHCPLPSLPLSATVRPSSKNLRLVSSIPTSLFISHCTLHCTPIPNTGNVLEGRLGPLRFNLPLQKSIAHAATSTAASQPNLESPNHPNQAAHRIVAPPRSFSFWTQAQKHLQSDHWNTRLPLQLITSGPDFQP